jgi:hypothetical protein
VERGDYRMIRAADNQTIDPSEFTRVVAPEMKFEMSIILQKMTAFQEIRGSVPDATMSIAMLRQQMAGSNGKSLSVSDAC